MWSNIIIVLTIMACWLPGPCFGQDRTDKSGPGRNLLLAENYASVSIPLDHYRSEWLLVNSLVFQSYYEGFATALFEDLTLYASDSGRTFYIASSQEDPEYDNFIQLLTDGQDEALSFRFANDGGGAEIQTNLESYWFADLAGGNQTDLGGCQVKGLSLEVTDLTFSTYYGPFGMFFTDVFFKGRLIVAYEK